MVSLVNNSVDEDDFQYFKTEKKTQKHGITRQWEIVLTSIILETVVE